MSNRRSNTFLDLFGGDIAGCLGCGFVIALLTGGLSAVLSGLLSGLAYLGVFALGIIVGGWVVIMALWGLCACLVVLFRNKCIHLTEYNLTPSGLWFVWYDHCDLLVSSDMLIERKLGESGFFQKRFKDLETCRILAGFARIPCWPGMVSMLCVIATFSLLIAILKQAFELGRWGILVCRNAK